MGLGRDGDRDAQRHFPNARERGIDTAEFEVGRIHHAGKRAGCREEHRVGDLTRFAGQHAEADAREDVDVVALSWHVAPTLELDLGERAARRKDRAPVRPRIRLFRRALGLGRRVREREHDRPRVECSHLSDDGLREGLRHARYPDESRRLQRLHRLAERRDERMVVGVWQLVVCEVGPRLHDEALRVDEPATGSRVGLAHASGHRGRHIQVGDARAGFARAEEQQLLLCERATCDAQRRHHACQRHGGGALDVVVEAGQLLAVLAEQAERVGVAEVLPLQQRLGEDGGDRGHELLDERVVLRAPGPLLPEPDVDRPVEQFLVVGADVDGDRQRVGRVDAGARRVERELAHRDAHAQRAEVPEPEDALAVGDDDQANTLERPVAQHLGDAALVAQREEQAARTPEDGAVLEAGLAHRRRVDQRDHLLDVVHDEAVEQDLVPVLEVGQVDVLLERVRLAPYRGQTPGRLLLEREHPRRQQAAQSERVALAFGEGGALVEQGIGQERGAAGLKRRAPRGEVGG